MKSFLTWISVSSIKMRKEEVDFFMKIDYRLSAIGLQALPSEKQDPIQRKRSILIEIIP